MRDFLLFIIMVCVGLALMAAYSMFISRRTPVIVPSLQNIFRTSNFSLEKAPGESLIGKIVSMNGDVEWQSRTATDSAKLSSLINIQQGEDLETREKSTATVLFGKNLEVDLNEKTRVSFIQTLPFNIVMTQASGSAEYKKLGNVPVSIRVMHLLIENAGDVIIDVDNASPVVTLQVVSGSAKYSFNDINNVTSITEITAGKKLIFNDDTRQGVTK